MSKPQDNPAPEPIPYCEVLHPLPEEHIPPPALAERDFDVMIIGGGIAGISAAIYLGRAMRRTVVIDAGQSLAQWEPEVQNYLGFPDGVGGPELLSRGKQQAEKYGVQFIKDEVLELSKETIFSIKCRKAEYSAKRLLIATGLYHLPPEICEVNDCLGHSMFFCKDCDGFKVRGKRLVVVGSNDDAVEYALGLMVYSPCVMIATNGKQPAWDEQHKNWINEYCVPVYLDKICGVTHAKGMMTQLDFSDGVCAEVDFLFTTRGDIFHNKLAQQLGAELDKEGQIAVNHLQRTSVAGCYAAGCVTPANCQMIIAAGQGATAAQAINRDLFEESLATHSLRKFREKQVREEDVAPVLIPKDS